MILLLALVSFGIEPAVITDCTDGLGEATLRWSGAGNRRVQIRLLAPNGDPMTGWEGPDGSVPTGPWVTDGMAFHLVDEAGVRLAGVTAQVRCGYTPSSVDPVFTTGSYLPLQPGNEWTFRVNNRQATGFFITWTVDGVREVNGRSYSVIRTGGDTQWLVRQDADGRIFEWAPSGDRLYLDPTPTPDPSALLRITSRGAFSNSLGSFPDALHYQRFDALILGTGTFVRGLGLARTSDSMLSGSSGGFTQGFELVEARLDGRLVLAVPAPRLEIGVESSHLNVTGKKVRDCAVPCYFVACGLAPGADPPGTWKPCFSAQVRGAGEAAVLTLEDAAGRMLRQFDITGAKATVSIPLYEQPNRPYPAGIYRVRVRGSNGAEGSLPLTIE